MEPIPFVSLSNFFQRFSPSGKKLFQLFLILLLLASGAWIWGTLHLNTAGISYSTQEETSAVLLPWLPDEGDDNSLAQFQAQVYSNFTLQLPGLLMPAEWSVWALLLAYGFFWAGTLTLASRMKQYWNFFPPFLFAFWLAQANVGVLIVGSDPWYLTTLLISLVFLLPLYYFQRSGREWSTLIVFLFFLFLMCLLLAAIGFIAGKSTLFQLQASVLPIHYLFACLALLLASNVPLSLITALLTNRKELNSRSSLPLMLLTWMAFIAFASIWLLGFDSWLPHSLQKLFPVLLGVLALVAWPFTAQNAFHAARTAFGTNLAYTLSVLVLALNALCFFAYAALNGDFLMQLQAFRMVVFLFPIMALLQIIYWMVNFYDVFKARQNLYFILHMPTRIRFLIVWIAIAIITGITEGRKSWKTIQLMTASSYSRAGDMFLLAGQEDSASLRYDTALMIIPGDPKSNYNSGIMLLKPGKSPLPALERLQASRTSNPDFTAGEIQAASYFAFVGKYRQALEILRKTQEQTHDREVPNLMAWLYLKLQNPDSAVVCLQQALREDPEYAAACSNLGMLYFRFNKHKEAHTFFELAKECAGADPGPYANMMFAQLAGMDSLEFQWNPDWLIEEASASFLANALIWCSRNGMQDQADELGQILERKGASVDFLQYKMVRCLQMDSIPQALSRYAWLTKSSPREAGLAAHNMGVFYHQADVPEMALRFYQDAATHGSQLDELLAGIVMAQTGEQDSAYKRFSRVRAFAPEWQDQARKEIALLLLANGQEVYASLEWNFADAQYKDWMRGAKYAAASGNKGWFIEMLRKAIEKDSSAWQPYDLLGRWYLDRKDEEALQTFRDGLEILPNNPWLQTEYQTASLQLKAEPALTSFQIPDSLGQISLLANVEFLVHQKRFAQADSLLVDWIKENPLDTRALFRLGDLWQTTAANPDRASEYFFNALSCNDRNPRLWLYYAAFSSAAGLKEQAGYGALQASQLSRDAAYQKDILNTFATEIQIWREAGL